MNPSPSAAPAAAGVRGAGWRGVLGAGLRGAWATVRAADPFLQLALVAVCARVVGLFAHYLGSDLLGHPISLEPHRFLPWAIPFHVGVLLAVGVTFAGLSRALRRGRRVLFGAATFLFGLLVMYGQGDLEMLRGLGQHVTPRFLGQHLGPAMFSDVAGIIADDVGHVIVSSAFVVAAWVGLWWVWRRRRPALGRPRGWGGLSAAVAITAGLIIFPHAYSYSGNRLRVVTPPEVLALAQLVSADSTAAPDDPALAANTLRARVAPAGADWLDDEYPLVRAVPAARAPERLPDIVVVVIESLRGAELLPAGEDPRADHPHLAALARGGVVYPWFISNGFPSAQGFFALQCSAWPHPRRYVLSDFAGGNFDCLSPRLHERGYETAFFSASNPSMDNQLPWVRRLYQHIEVPHGKTYDRQMVDNFLGWLERYDAAEVPGDERPPLFAWVATASLHTPFAPRDPELAGPVPETLSARYSRALRYTDGQVGRILATLSERARRDDTVVIVVGDHGSPLEHESTVPERAAAPCDRLVWTSAVVSGPAALIGASRVEAAPASQVDLMPTILAMVGDDRPTAALGRDLLDATAGERSAVAVTRAGVRLDVGAHEAYASPDGEAVWVSPRRGPGSCDGGASSEALEARALRALGQVETWSWLLEEDRVWHPRFLTAAPPRSGLHPERSPATDE